MADTPVQKYGQLRVKGNRIVDQHGEPVQLRGMSLFWSQWKPQFYNAETIHWLASDWHCQIVRAAIGVENHGYLEDPDREMKKLDAVMQAAIDSGIYLIVDWHSDNPHPAEAEEFFSKVSAKYGKYPNIIYETWNEPLPKYNWSTVIKPYHQTVIRKIRENDAKNLIICGTRAWSQNVDEAAADPLKFDNVAYTLHFYAATHKQWLRDKAQKAMDRGIALMVTEWGPTEASGTGKIDLTETHAWWDFMDKNHLSWCDWSITDKDETSAALVPGTAGGGNWSLDSITTSGKMIRNELRAKNP